MLSRIFGFFFFCRTRFLFCGRYTSGTESFIIENPHDTADQGRGNSLYLPCSHFTRLAYRREGRRMVWDGWFSVRMVMCLVDLLPEYADSLPPRGAEDVSMCEWVVR